MAKVNLLLSEHCAGLWWLAVYSWGQYKRFSVVKLF